MPDGQQPRITFAVLSSYNDFDDQQFLLYFRRIKHQVALMARSVKWHVLEQFIIQYGNMIKKRVKRNSNPIDKIKTRLESVFNKKTITSADVTVLRELFSQEFSLQQFGFSKKVGIIHALCLLFDMLSFILLEKLEQGKDETNICRKSTPCVRAWLKADKKNHRIMPMSSLREPGMSLRYLIVGHIKNKESIYDNKNTEKLKLHVNSIAESMNLNNRLRFQEQYSRLLSVQDQCSGVMTPEQQAVFINKPPCNIEALNYIRQETEKTFVQSQKTFLDRIQSVADVMSWEQLNQDASSTQGQGKNKSIELDLLTAAYARIMKYFSGKHDDTNQVISNWELLVKQPILSHTNGIGSFDRRLHAFLFQEYLRLHVFLQKLSNRQLNYNQIYIFYNKQQKRIKKIRQIFREIISYEPLESLLVFWDYHTDNQPKNKSQKAQHIDEKECFSADENRERFRLYLLFKTYYKKLEVPITHTDYFYCHRYEDHRFLTVYSFFDKKMKNLSLSITWQMLREWIACHAFMFVNGKAEHVADANHVEQCIHKLLSNACMPEDISTLCQLKFSTANLNTKVRVAIATIHARIWAILNHLLINKLCAQNNLSDEMLSCLSVWKKSDLKFTKRQKRYHRNEPIYSYRILIAMCINNPIQWVSNLDRRKTEARAYAQSIIRSYFTNQLSDIPVQRFSRLIHYYVSKTEYSYSTLTTEPRDDEKTSCSLFSACESYCNTQIFLDRYQDPGLNQHLRHVRKCMEILANRLAWHDCTELLQLEASSHSPASTMITQCEHIFSTIFIIMSCPADMENQLKTAFVILSQPAHVKNLFKMLFAMNFRMKCHGIILQDGLFFCYLYRELIILYLLIEKFNGIEFSQQSEQQRLEVEKTLCQWKNRDKRNRKRLPALFEHETYSALCQVLDTLYQKSPLSSSSEKQNKVDLAIDPHREMDDDQKRYATPTQLRVVRFYLKQVDHHCNAVQQPVQNNTDKQVHPYNLKKRCSTQPPLSLIKKQRMG